MATTLSSPLTTIEHYEYANDSTLVIHTDRTFDERSRQLTEQTTIDGTIVSNATFSYDELGRMKRLELGDNVAINTSYNLQGWIDAISSVSSSSGDGLVLSEDIFTERLSYYDPVDANSTPRYSGKISEQRWAHGSIMNGLKGFAYTYDSMGRLTDAQMFTSSTSQNKPLIGTTREQIAYDKNSNVVQLSDTRGLSTTTRHYAVQGNQVVQMIVNGNNLGYPVYDERGNMTQNIEAGLQMSYNLCNLPKQITTVNGKTVKYTYFADGTKFKAVDATGKGFAYTGSLRWRVQNGALAPESIAITGGRAIFTDNSWATNYYITDHLGSVRAVTDAEGEVLDTFDYMPYGSEISSTSSATTDYRFTGKERQSMVNNSIYDSFARFQNTYGRFMSIDPKAESFYHISPYTYCAGDPVNLVDPDGEVCGVYYDEYGNYIADDNIDDGKLYITNKETADLWEKEMRVSGDISNALNILQSGSTEVDGIIIITRTSETQQYTRGEFLAIGSNNFSGYTMERPGPASYEAGKKLPIPRGLYDTKEREGQFHGTFAFRIFNDKVSIKRGILGHIGNTPDDSEGCILFGMGMGSGNSISQSKIAMTKFEVYFQNKDNVKLIIR